MCHFVLVFYSPFSIAITSLGEERANLSAFRTFVRFVLVWICRFPLLLGGLGRAAVCDCGTPWTFLLPFFLEYRVHCWKFCTKVNKAVQRIAFIPKKLSFYLLSP